MIGWVGVCERLSCDGVCDVSSQSPSGKGLSPFGSCRGRSSRGMPPLSFGIQWKGIISRSSLSGIREARGEWRSGGCIGRELWLMVKLKGVLSGVQGAVRLERTEYSVSMWGEIVWCVFPFGPMRVMVAFLV